MCSRGVALELKNNCPVCPRDSLDALGDTFDGKLINQSYCSRKRPRMNARSVCAVYVLCPVRRLNIVAQKAPDISIKKHGTAEAHYAHYTWLSVPHSSLCVRNLLGMEFSSRPASHRRDARPCCCAPEPPVRIFPCSRRSWHAGRCRATGYCVPTR